MTINRALLHRALSLITIADGETVRTGRFVDLSGDLHFKCVLEQGMDETTNRRYRDVLQNLLYVAKDLWNIETFFDRLNWQHNLWIDGKIDHGMWSRYATADIDMLHVEARSLFDYLAAVLRRIAVKPGQVPESFEKMRNWALDTEKNRQSLGTDLANLLAACTWFSDLRGVRDDIVHRGAETVVFLEKPHFLFQTYQNSRKKITHAEAMANENVVDFPTYAGMIYGYILDFLESVSELVYLKLNLNRNEGRSRHHSPGIELGKTWITKAIEQSAGADEIGT